MFEIKKLTKIYKLSAKRSLIAVNNLDLTIEKGETVGLIGASGAGKSTLGRMVLGLIAPTSGEIFFEGRRKKGLHPRRMQMIFQNPYSSLNPKMRVESILKEPTEIHGLKERVDELLDLVNLPRDAKKRMPHEFSGGERQRIAIARALALNPDFLICDEPFAALDVSIRSQILNLLQKLQRDLGLTMLFIAHDLTVIREISTRVAVMREGKIIQICSKERGTELI